MFPKRNLASQKGLEGQTFFQHFVVNHLKCIYHPVNQENDSGIDGYIELVVEGNVTGKMIGVQIKHGNSYFRTKTKSGYKYIGENKHLNYYLNQQLPIFIVIIDDNFERQLWQEFDLNKIIPSGSNNWSIEISENNSLITNFYEEIFSEVSPIVDFDEVIQWNLALNLALRESEFRVIAVSEYEIDTMNFDKINDFIERLSANEELLIKSSSSLDIFFPEYLEDTREIFQIPEIVRWLKHSIDKGIPWFYFLDTNRKNNGLHLLLHAYCSSTNVKFDAKRYLANYSPEDLSKFFEKNFINLNRFMEKYCLVPQLNREISESIVEYFDKQMV